MFSSTVDTIKERLGIVEVVSGYLELQKAGSNLKAKCPFHNEKTPSFTVSPTRNTYYCFGCSAHGDIFSFIEQFEGLDFPGALRVLGERAGVQVVYEPREKQDERARLYEAMEEATRFFEQGLSGNQAARDYLRGRGIAEGTIVAFRLGYAKPAWRSLCEHLHSRHFTDRELEQAGLIKRGEGNLYDRFRGRIMFPLADSSGRIVAFSGRIFDEPEGADAAKYLNSPETPLFNKSAILFGFDKAKMSIRRFGCSIVVEGQMDLVLSHQAGFTNTVALSGTALSQEHTALLKRLSSNVILAFDGDAAGITATGRSAETALGSGMDVKVAVLPEGADPADIIQTSPAEWKKAIREARHIVEFYLDVIGRQGHDERAFRLNVSRIVLPFISRIENAIDREHFVQIVARHLAVSEETVRDELRRLTREHPPGHWLSDNTIHAPKSVERVSETSHSRKDVLAQSVFGWLAYERAHPAHVESGMPDIMERLRSVMGAEEFEVHQVRYHSDGDAFLFSLEEVGKENTRGDIQEILVLLEEECIKERYARALGDLRRAEGAADTSAAADALERCAGLSRELSALAAKKQTSVMVTP